MSVLRESSAAPSRLFADGFWRRWSGLSNKNLNLDDVLVVWNDDVKIRNKLLFRLCRKNELKGNKQAIATTAPLWFKKDNPDGLA